MIFFSRLQTAIFALILLSFPWILTGTAEAQPPDEPAADELRERFKGEYFSLGILLQSQGFFSLDNSDFNGGRSWDLGSTRIDFRGTVDRNFTYRVRVYFLSQQQNIDARVGYRFSDNFQIIAGAFKPYTSKDLDPSPARLDFVRRARLVGAMMNTLEIGISAIGEVQGFKYRFGMYNGDGASGIAMQNDNNFLYTSRLSAQFEPAAGHTFEAGSNAAINRSINERVGNTGLTSTGDRLIYGAFLEYDGIRLFGTAEFLQSTFKAVDFNNARETITGLYTTLGLRVDSRNELLIRWDHLSFDLKGESSEQLLLGWNYYPTSLISFRINAISQFGNDGKNHYGAAGVFQFFF